MFARTTHKKYIGHRALSNYLVSSVTALRETRGLSKAAVVSYLEGDYDMRNSDALNAWNAVAQTVSSNGDGNSELGYERLLDGPMSGTQFGASEPRDARRASISI